MAKVGEREMNGALGDADSKLTDDPKCQSKVSSRCPEFCQLIGRRETKTIELSKREHDLRRRLEMLECWMPAVTMMGMMTRDVKADDIARVIDKQAAGMTVSCLCPNATLSQHRDVRIREVEGKRKKAERRLEEARRLLHEKQTAVEEQTARIEEERRKRVKLEERVKQLEAKISRSNGLDRAPSAESIASIGPDELMYLTKLEELLKSEAASKRQLEELEKRQEMYVKALETASQIWSEEEHHEKVNGLTNELEVKVSANQQLAERICQLEDQVENLKSKLVTCNDKLKIFTEKQSREAMVETEQAHRDVELLVTPDFKDVSVIYDDSEFMADEAVDASVPTETRETSAIVEVTERAVQEIIYPPEHEDAETTTEQEPHFVSLDESIWKGEKPSTSPLIYDTSVHELGTKPRTTKFDVQTQTADNYVCIEIPELAEWETNIGKVRSVILQCDTCSSTDPEVLKIQEAINLRLGREFIDIGLENFAAQLDKLSTAGSRVVSDQQLEPAPSFMTKKLEELRRSSEILLAGGIGGVSLASLATPPESVLAPESTSTPMTHVSRRVSRISLVMAGPVITPMTPVVEEVSGDRTIGDADVMESSLLTTPADEIMRKISTEVPSALSTGGVAGVSGVDLPAPSQVMEKASRVSTEVPSTFSTGGVAGVSVLDLPPSSQVMEKVSREVARYPEKSGAHLPAASQMMQIISSEKISQQPDISHAGLPAASQMMDKVWSKKTLQYFDESEAHLRRRSQMLEPMSSEKISQQPHESTAHLPTSSQMMENSSAETSQYLDMPKVRPPTSSQMMKEMVNDTISQHSDMPSRLGLTPEESTHSRHLATIDGSDHSASMDRDYDRGTERPASMMGVYERSNLAVQMKSRESVGTRSVATSGLRRKIDGSEGDEAENELVVISGHEREEIEDKKEMNDGREETISDQEENIREPENVVRKMIDGKPGEIGGTDEEIMEEKIKLGEVEKRMEDTGSGGIPVIESPLTTNIQLESREIREVGKRVGGEAISGGILCGTVDSMKNVDDGRNKCPVTSKLSSCICHALRRWPRMTRKEYQQSKEAITKIPPPTQQPRKITSSKTVSSATVENIEIQTNVERLNEIPEVISDANSDMCDPCECEPCASVSSTSSELDPIGSRQPTVETRDQGVMAKIYRARR